MDDPILALPNVVLSPHNAGRLQYQRRQHTRRIETELSPDNAQKIRHGGSVRGCACKELYKLAAQGVVRHLQMHDSTLPNSVRRRTLGWTIHHHWKDLLDRDIRGETFSMLNSVLQHRDRRTIRTKLLQPLCCACDVVGFRGDNHPINLERLNGIGHEGALHLKDAIRRFNR